MKRDTSESSRKWRFSKEADRVRVCSECLCELTKFEQELCEKCFRKLRYPQRKDRTESDDE